MGRQLPSSEKVSSFINLYNEAWEAFPRHLTHQDIVGEINKL